MVKDACCFPEDSGSDPSKEVLAGVDSGKDLAFGSQMVLRLTVFTWDRNRASSCRLCPRPLVLSGRPSSRLRASPFLLSSRCRLVFSRNEERKAELAFCGKIPLLVTHSFILAPSSPKAVTLDPCFRPVLYSGSFP